MYLYLEENKAELCSPLHLSGFTGVPCGITTIKIKVKFNFNFNFLILILILIF